MKPCRGQARFWSSASLPLTRAARTAAVGGAGANSQMQSPRFHQQACANQARPQGNPESSARPSQRNWLELTRCAGVDHKKAYAHAQRLTWTAFDFAGLAALLANSSAGCSSGGRQASGCMRMKPFRLYSTHPDSGHWTTVRNRFIGWKGASWTHLTDSTFAWAISMLVGIGDAPASCKGLPT